VRHAALFLAVTACWSSPPKVSPPAGSGSASPITSTAPTVGAPPAFTPPTTGLAVGIATFLAIDDVGQRVFVRKDSGIDILALDSGKPIGHVDVRDGELYPAGKQLLSLHYGGLALDVALIDPAGRVDATCHATVKMPAKAEVTRVDVFTTHAGKTYLKWEGSAPEPMRGGAAMRPEEIDELSRNFQATYACGLLEVTRPCTLVARTFKDAGLESCETRSMPWPRYLPTPIGSLALSTERSGGQRGYLMLDIETFIVKDATGERWRLPIETRATPPPAP
jgi:hypothetical protein